MRENLPLSPALTSHHPANPWWEKGLSPSPRIQPSAFLFAFIILAVINAARLLVFPPCFPIALCKGLAPGEQAERPPELKSTSLHHVLWGQVPKLGQQQTSVSGSWMLMKHPSPELPQPPTLPALQHPDLLRPFPLPKKIQKLPGPIYPMWAAGKAFKAWRCIRATASRKEK